MDVTLNGARIHYKKVTDSHPRDIPDDQIVKGYEVSEGEYVTLTDEEIAAAHVEGDKVIEIHDFVPLDEIDPIAFERTYYLGPTEGAERVYALLARALESSGLVGVASFVFHDRDQLACLRVRDGAILLERMQGSFDHSAYHDRYRERLMAIVDKKRKGETITAPKVQERRVPDDLMAALEESLNAAVGKARKAPRTRTKARAKAPKARAGKKSRSKG